MMKGALLSLPTLGLAFYTRPHGLHVPHTFASLNPQSNVTKVTSQSTAQSTERVASGSHNDAFDGLTACDNYCHGSIGRLRFASPDESEFALNACWNGCMSIVGHGQDTSTQAIVDMLQSMIDGFNNDSSDAAPLVHLQRCVIQCDNDSECQYRCWVTITGSITPHNFDTTSTVDQSTALSTGQSSVHPTNQSTTQEIHLSSSMGASSTSLLPSPSFGVIQTVLAARDDDEDDDDNKIINHIGDCHASDIRHRKLKCVDKWMDNQGVPQDAYDVRVAVQSCAINEAQKSKGDDFGLRTRQMCEPLINPPDLTVTATIESTPCRAGTIRLPPFTPAQTDLVPRSQATNAKSSINTVNLTSNVAISTMTLPANQTLAWICPTSMGGLEARGDHTATVTCQMNPYMCGWTGPGACAPCPCATSPPCTDHIPIETKIIVTPVSTETRYADLTHECGPSCPAYCKNTASSLKSPAGYSALGLCIFVAAMLLG